MNQHISYLARRFRCAMPAILPLAVMALLTACGSTSPAGNGQAPGTVPAAGATIITQASQAGAVQESQAWGQDDCLHNYVTAAGQVLSDTATNLCRSATMLDGQTSYYAFERDKTPAAWVEQFETPGDGDFYWRYPATSWFRQAAGGGPEQIEVQYPSGATGYQNLGHWETSSGQGFYENIKLRLSELAVADLMRQAYTVPVSSSQLTETQLQQAQHELQQKDQQIQALQQQAQANAAQNGNSQVTTDEYQYLTQLHGLEDQVWTQDNCDYAGYCGP